MYFIVAMEGSAHCRKRRKVIALTAVVMGAIAIAGTLGCILSSTIAVAIAEGLIRIIAIAKAAHRIGAWLCHTTFVVDFALVIRTSLRIAFSSESPKTWSRRPTNLAATFRS